jgi:uncharacterized RDD family membrane protein YckC
MLYDGLLVVALLMFTLFALTGLNGFEAVHGPGVNSLLFLELYGFFAYFWVRRGQTLGMLAWRLQVRSNGLGRFTLTQATLRFLGALVSFACLGAGYLWILIDPSRRSWSDLLSSSRVVYLAKFAT